MNLFNRIFVTVLLLWIGIPGISAKNNFRVSDSFVTVFREPQRINALGRLHKGEEFEAIGNDGSLLIFMYKGQKAYIASYCCEKIEESPDRTAKRTRAGTQASKAEAASGKEMAKEASESGAKTRKKYVTRSVGSAGAGIVKDEVPGWIKGLLGIFVMLGFVSGIWSLFGTQSFNGFFDGLARKRITSCSRLMHWRPVVPFVVGSLIGNLTGSVTLALWSILVYEAIVIFYRSKSLRSVRAALIEAVYLVLYAMGSLLFFYMFIILAFLAAGGSGGSGGPSSGGEGKKRRDGTFDGCCGNCALWHSETHRCGRNGALTRQGDYCNGHVWC